jgi:hypothetical protein
MTEEETKLATFEIERLQEIIFRHESHSTTIRGWLFTILTALSAVAFSKGLPMSKTTFAVISLAVSVLFFLWELYHHAVVRLALERVELIERQLRSPPAETYDGPRICATLRRPISWDDLAKSVKHPLNYVAIIVVVISLGLVIAFARDERVQPPLEVKIVK